MILPCVRITRRYSLWHISGCPSVLLFQDVKFTRNCIVSCQLPSSSVLPCFNPSSCSSIRNTQRQQSARSAYCVKTLHSRKLSLVPPRFLFIFMSIHVRQGQEMPLLKIGFCSAVSIPCLGQGQVTKHGAFCLKWNLGVGDACSPYVIHC